MRGLEEFADALAKGEKITRKFRCHRVILDLHAVPYSCDQVKETRALLKVSQAIFAQFLGVKPATIRSWEQGRNHPPDMACRFMDEIRRHPDHFRRILRKSIRVTRPSGAK